MWVEMVDKQSIEDRREIYDLQQHPRRGRAAMELSRLEDLSPAQKEALQFYHRLFVAAKNGDESPLVGHLGVEVLDRYISTTSRVQEGDWPEDWQRQELRQFFVGVLHKLRQQCRTH